ncbi:MAG: DUF222 domain-containing protein [Actinobacteria bacterium]|nr:DUF222 domain-containing protein [Actinomycetota bacterium]
MNEAPSVRLLELMGEWERAEAEVLSCLGEWDRAGTWGEDGACTPVAWLTNRAPVTKGDAVRLIRAARLAGDHDRTGKALAAGDIKSAHVHVLARAVRHREDQYPDHEDVLIDAATEHEPEWFRHLARQWRAIADDVAAGAEAEKQFEHRRFHCSATFGGTVVGDFELDPEGGAIVLAALEARDQPDPVTEGDLGRSRSQRWADNFVEIMAEDLERPPPGGRVPHTVDLVVDADTLAGTPPSDLGAARCELDLVGPVAPETARRLACDAAIGRVVTQGRSEILDLGRRTRLVSRAQRRALARRDRGCGFPGCDRPHWWCDAHHIVHWIRGGGTDLDNLILLCRRHHVLSHEGGWKLERAPDGTITAVPP